MTDLSLAYQQERPDLEPTDLTTLTLRSLCHYAINSISAVNNESPDTHDIIFSTADITDLAKQLIVDDELSINAEQVSVRRIGRVCGRMRLREKQRRGGKGKRQWSCTKGELRRWLISYGIPLPESLFNDVEGVPLSTNGTNGIDGTNGIEPQALITPNIPLAYSTPSGQRLPCKTCGGSERWQDGNVWRCVKCWPPAQPGRI
jgi:hypothetical protein